MNRALKHLDQEIRDHIARETLDNIDRGMTPQDAHRAAVLRFGNVALVKEDTRAVWVVVWLEQALRDIRFGIRGLAKSPGFTAVAVVSLALGIGANAATFSLFNQILLRPLPVVEPERLVNLEAPGPRLRIRNPSPTARGRSTSLTSCDQAVGCDGIFSYPMFRDLQRDNTVFTDIAAHRPFVGNTVYDGQTFSGDVVLVSGSYFPMLGLVPALGRLLGPEVDAPVGGHPVVVVSHDFWQSRLGGRPDILGDPVSVNGQPFTIVGVAPPGFRGTTLGVRPMLLAPITMRLALWPRPRYVAFENDRSLYWVYLFARLKPGVSIAQAGAALEPLYWSLLSDEAPLAVNLSEQTMAQFLSKPIPITDGRRGQSAMDEETRVPLLLLFGVTGFVVLIACANIANLLLARAAVRASEMAVRLSIGAARRHLLAQLLTESCLLALIGGAAGLIVARWTLGGIGVLLPPEAVNAVQLTLDPSVVLFTVAISLLTGLLLGIVPALQSTRADLISTLKDQAGQPAGARAAARFRNGLVTAQFALSTTLLVAAGLFIQSLNNVTRVDLGIRTEDVTTFRLAPGLSGYTDEQQRQALYERVEAELAAQPGVTDVSVAYVPVFAGPGLGTSVTVEGFEVGPDTDRRVRWNGVGPGYYRTLGIPLLAGREFTESDVRVTRNRLLDRLLDRAGAIEWPKPIIVNEAFARKFNLGRIRSASGWGVAPSTPN